MESSELNILRNDEYMLSAIWRDVSVMIWWVTVDHTWIDKITHDINVMNSLLPQKHAALIVLKGRRDPPSDAIRKRLAEITATNAPNLIGVATVIEGDGFHSSITRGVVTDLELKVGRANRKTFYRVGEAIHWLTDHLGNDQSWGIEFAKQMSSLSELNKASP